MNGIWRSRINEVKIKRQTKIKVRNVGWVVVGIIYSDGLPLWSEEVNTRHVIDTKIESRIEIAAASASCSATTMLISKYDAMVKTKSLTEMDSESA